MPEKSAIKSFLSGGFGGICLVVCGHPLDLIKVRLQTSTAYRGMFDCARQTIAKEGIRGLYRGMLTPLLGVTPVFSVCFWGYDMGKRIAQNITASNPSQTAIAGAFSAVPTTALMTPMERIKCMVQVGASGPSAALRSVLQTSGVRGLFTGAYATLARDSVGSVMYFCTYEYVKHALSRNSDKWNAAHVLVAGGFAGMANWTFAIPFDVVKSRMQTAPIGAYSGVRDCLVKTVKADGVGALVSGLKPAMARAFPANAACFLGVEVSQKAMNLLF